MSEFEQVTVEGIRYYVCPACGKFVLSPISHLIDSPKCGTEMPSVKPKPNWAKAALGALHDFDFDE